MTLPRVTLPRIVARELQPTPARHSASLPHAQSETDALQEDVRWRRPGVFGRARARTLPRAGAMTTTLTYPNPRPARPTPQPPRALSIHPLDRERWNRRFVNIVAAAVGIVLALPLMLLIAVLIKLTSRGPVLFTQTRVGLDRRGLSRAGGNTRRHTDLGGVPFKIYKFRTMRPAAGDGKQVWAQADDARITAIGAVLRKLRLDELPQLFNVLKGEMNIVGPRPERPTIFAQLRSHIAEYPLRQRAKPGITGLAQINHHYDRSLDDVRTKVSYDLEYIRRQSLREDLRIMLKTIPVILLRRGGW